MPYENVLLGKANRVATTTLNRPPAHAMSMAHLRDIASALDEGLAAERSEFQRIGKTEDAQNGIRAFLSKQKAVFKGK